MQEALKALREFAEAALELRKASDAGEPAARAQLGAACVNGTALLLGAREASVQAALEAERLKEAAAAQRSELDHAALQLHNLLYEQEYYDKEIASCRAFASAVPEDALHCEAPPAAGGGGDAAASPEAHAAELARLTAELQQRKALKAQLQELQQQQRRAAAQLGAATGRMDELRSALEGVSSSSRPLLEAALPGAAAARADREAAELLPVPLFTLYTQAAAAADVVGLPLRVTIDGSTAAALQAQQAAAAAAAAQQQQQQEAGTGRATAAAAAAAAPPAPDAKRRRKSVQREDATYKVHPLSVCLDVLQPGGSGSGAGCEPLMALRFQYYTTLKLVGAAASSSDDEDVLTDLFLGDLGDGQLLESVAVCSSSGGSSGPYEFGQPGKPRPFRWAQELCGMDVLVSLPSALSGADRSQLLASLSECRSEMRLETFLERLTHAKHGKQVLKALLEQLARKQAPACSRDGRLPFKLSAAISTWRVVTDARQAGQQLPPTQQQLAAPGGRRSVQVWQPAQSSMQEEGEVADGAEASSRLQHGDTAAEEDLLQGLLADEAGEAAAAAAATAAAGAPDSEGVHGILLDDSYDEDDAMLRLLEDGVYKELSAEPSAGGSEAAEPIAQGADSPAGAGHAALLARHSVYRLVLRSAALELHAHVTVYLSYPLLPPVFSITRLLDTSRNNKGSPITAVNEVLSVEQQVNAQAVAAAIATNPCEVLALQICQLRQCADGLAAQLHPEAASKDLVEKLKARQQLRGRERQARRVLCG